MHPPEHGGVESCLQLIERPEVARPGDVPSNDSNRVIRHRGKNDVLGLDEQEPFADLHGHLLGPRLAALHQLDDAFELVVQRASGPTRRRALATAVSTRRPSIGFSR